MPSDKVVITYKHEKELHQEIAAAKGLMTMTADTLCTLHFDTTCQSRLDGECPASSFFAYEDRAEIVKLIVETFRRLAIATCDPSAAAAKLWEKTFRIMTDCVTKNL